MKQQLDPISFSNISETGSHILIRVLLNFVKENEIFLKR